MDKLDSSQSRKYNPISGGEEYGRGGFLYNCLSKTNEKFSVSGN